MIRGKGDFAATSFTSEVLASLQATFEPRRDPLQAAAMSAYMRNLFSYFRIESNAAIGEARMGSYA